MSNKQSLRDILSEAATKLDKEQLVEAYLMAGVREHQLRSELAKLKAATKGLVCTANDLLESLINASEWSDDPVTQEERSEYEATIKAAKDLT